MRYSQRNGTAKPSLTRDNLLTHGDMDILSEDEQISIMNVAGTLYEGMHWYNFLLPFIHYSKS